MQFTLISLLSLLALAATLPQSTKPLEKCTKADEGKLCNAGETNGFFVSGTYTPIPEREDQSQYVCFPGATLGGQAPAPNNGTD